MKHLIWKWLMLAVLCLSLGMNAAFAEGTAEAERVGDEYAEQRIAEHAANLEAYAPKITTLSNGVQVQRVPAPANADYVFENYFDNYANTYYNIEYLNAEQRGCAACHDMMTLTDNFKHQTHITMQNGMGIEPNVRTCQDCHAMSYLETTFANQMHVLHGPANKAFTALGGDCWSCHHLNDNREMALWDDVKHSVMRNIAKVPGEQMNGTFSWNQDKVLSADDSYFYSFVHDLTAIKRNGRAYAGLKPDPANDGVYDSWMLTVNGDVENPTTMSINDWIEAVGTETLNITGHCNINVNGGMLIANNTVTGMSVMKMLEYANPTEGANAFVARAYADWINQISSETIYVPIEYPFETAEMSGAYIVLEIGGEPLPYALGYPTVLYLPTNSSGWYLREVSEVTAVTREETAAPLPPAIAGAIAELAEGQIIPVGEPHTFEGYVHNLRGNVETIELSFDQGATWLSYPIENADPAQWVWWNYEWTPTVPGAYTITLRATGTGDVTTTTLPEIMFNVK